jgi:hypothetical protein
MMKPDHTGCDGDCIWNHVSGAFFCDIFDMRVRDTDFLFKSKQIGVKANESVRDVHSAM